MPFTLTHFPRTALAGVAAFVATVALLAVLRSDDADPAAARTARALAAAEAPVPRPSAPAAERIRALQRQVALRPTADGDAGLAGAHLQLARETADATAYARAEDAIRRALRRDPANAAALVEASTLAAARHRFPEALALALRARAAAPDVVKSYGVLVDALVELGRLPAAERALQRMIDLQPSSGAYARASYLRELRGDLRGARTAMRLAASAGGEVPEHAASLRALLGDIELRLGRVEAARHEYRGALARFAGLPKAELGLARVDAAAGRLGAARRRLAGLVERLPLPEHAIALGEIELALGHRDAAQGAFELVRIQQSLLAGAGVRTDADLAVYEADHGSPRRAVDIARRAVAAEEGLRAPDALGWALTRSGRPQEGLTWARRALRLSAADPFVAYHAGVAAAGAGRPELARRWLRRALAGRAVLGPWHAEGARRALEAVR